jgi:hypothetical protein
MTGMTGSAKAVRGVLMRLLVAALVCAAGAARADEGKSDLDKELGTLDLCPQIKGILKSGEQGWDRVKGKEGKSSEKATHYKGKMSLPEASSCELVLFKDGSSFYACDLHTSSCKKTEKQYEKFTLDIALCIDNNDAKVKSADGRLTTRWTLPSKLVITSELKKKEDDCRITFFVDKLADKK